MGHITGSMQASEAAVSVRFAGCLVTGTFCGTAFVSAFLLFFLEPLFAKMLLPMVGGSPAVWTACMMFFQAALLTGYAYAHALPRWLGVRRHAALHAGFVLLPLLVLPITVRPAANLDSAGGVSWVVSTTAVSVGLPFVVLATSAPLLQAWFARQPRKVDPYLLYAASNTGSFSALLAYPVLIEPHVGVANIARLWAAGYGVAVVAVLICAGLVLRWPDTIAGRVTGLESAVSVWERVKWLALSMVPSSLLLGVTSFLTLDVAPVPLLWVVPLAIYLASFVLVFSERGRVTVAPARRLLPFFLLTEVVLLATNTALPLAPHITLHLATFSLLVVLCHGRLAESRPSALGLTEFYLWVAIGGALGGTFNTLLAPHVFADITEYPAAIVMACALLGSRSEARELFTDPGRWVRPVGSAIILAGGLWAIHRLRWPVSTMAPIMAISAALSFSVFRQPTRFALSVGLVLLSGKIAARSEYGTVLAQWRTFFGVYRVVHDGASGEFTTLYHGTTVHGRARWSEQSPEPLTYYHRGSPIGELFSLNSPAAIQNVGVVGLGVGSLAAYAAPGQSWVFYEIDPRVEQIARDNRWFRFLEHCGTGCRVVIGDGRLALASSRDQYDVLVLDAFSSDSIPMHLLSSEAAEIYLRHLRPHGVLAFHISNRHIALGTVVARLAAHLHLAVAGRADAVAAHDKSGRTGSVWVMMARDRRDISALASRPGWKWLTPDVGPAWSDDFSSLWDVVSWWH